MSFFEKLKSGLTKTRNNIFYAVRSDKLSEEYFERVEEALSKHASGPGRALVEDWDTPPRYRRNEDGTICEWDFYGGTLSGIRDHGANDRPNGVERYLQKYEELLDVIREHNPNAVIISLSAFVGTFHGELGEMIERYNQKHGCCVHFIDSFGWIPEVPLHPLRDGHSTVAKNLIPLRREIVK